MQVSVESTSGLERKMNVQVPAERIDQEVEKRLKSMAGRVKVDGFRPGKVPFKIVKQRYGQDVLHEVVGEVMQSTFYEAVSQEKLRPAGAPSIDAKTIEPGKALEFEAIFEIYPDVEPASVQGVKIDTTTAEVAAADIDTMIENLRKQRMSWQKVDRASEKGDQVIIDFEGSMDGVPFEGGKAENMPIELGAGRMIASLEDQLVGLKAGDETTLDVNFPEDYHTADLAGKPTQFAIKVHEVQESVLPEVDEELARQFGIEDGSVDKLREEIGNNMKRELEQAIRKNTKTQVMNALLELNELDVPAVMVAEEVKALREQMMQSLGQQQAQLDAGQFPDSFFEEDAKRRVTLGLIIGEIIRKEEMKPEEDRVTKTLEDLSANYEDAQQVIDFYRSNQQAMMNVESMVLEDQIVDWVLGQADVNETTGSFDEIMNPQQDSNE
jgi:trigger factor